MMQITEKKYESVMDQINWRIEDAQDEVASNKRRIQMELESFNEITSPMHISHYAMNMAAATEKLQELYQQKKALEYLIEE